MEQHWGYEVIRDGYEYDWESETALWRDLES